MLIRTAWATSSSSGSMPELLGVARQDEQLRAR